MDSEEPPGEPAVDVDAIRLSWLREIPDDAHVSDLLGLALAQAVAGTGGLGGMVHLSGWKPGSLRLAAASGVPAPIVQPWELLDGAVPDLAPLRAVRLGQVVWSKARPPATGAAPPRACAGTLSAPVVSAGVAVGALSVMAEEPPAEERQRFLAGLAGVLGARLPADGHGSGGAGPWWQAPLDWRTMREVRVGVWRWNLASGELDFDQPAADLLTLAGIDPDAWDRRVETWLARIHPDDRHGVDEAIARSLRVGSPYAVEYRVLDRDGRSGWLEQRGTVSYDADTRQPTGMAGTVWNVTARRRQEAWLVAMLRAHPQPVYILARDDRVEWANQAAGALAAREGAEVVVGRTPREAVPLLSGQGVPEFLARARAAPDATATWTVKRREPERGPAGDSASYELRAVCVGGHLTVTVADVTARTRGEPAAAERGRRVNDLIGALIRALYPSEVMAVLTRHVLPLVGADGLVVYDVTGTSPQLVGVVGYPPKFTERLRAERWPPDDDPTEDIGFVTSLEELTRRWPGLTEMAHLSGMRTWAMVPLVSRDRRVGSCIIAWKRTREFSAEDRALIGRVAVYIATALDNTRLYEQAHGRAERLQRELLPRTQPDLVAVETATRWRAAAGQDVGGDWYDTIPLPGGRTLAVIGDVTGRGLEQSIAMGILRHTVLTIAALDLPLDELIARVGDVVARVRGPSPDASFHATCLMVLYDPTVGACTVASAGHPAPVVLEPGAEPRSLDITPGAPLGVAQGVDPIPVQVTETVLEPGSAVVLFTDGVLGGADPGRLIGVVSRYAATARTPTGRSQRARWLSGLCTAITRDLPPDPRNHDDAALLALHTERVPAGAVTARDLPCSPQSAARARDLVLGRLPDWGLEHLADEAALVVSELVGNTVRHAVGIGADAAGDDSGMIRLRLLHLGGSLVCEVYDGSEATPRVRHPALDDEFGRGLQLVALTSTSWGARYTEHGKCIWASLGQLTPATGKVPATR